MNIGDFSGNQWVNVFSSEAEKILEKTAQEIGMIMEDNTDAGAAIFQEANFKQFVFKCRAKVETYNVCIYIKLLYLPKYCFFLG